jgi:hypothetical protein
VTGVATNPNAPNELHCVEEEEVKWRLALVAQSLLSYLNEMLRRTR